MKTPLKMLSTEIGWKKWDERFNNQQRGQYQNKSNNPNHSKSGLQIVDIFQVRKRLPYIKDFVIT